VEIPQWNNWRTSYDKVVSVSVPPGRHTVSAEAAGRDRLQVEYVVRGVPATADYNPVRVLAFDDGQMVYAWLQDRRSTWTGAGQEAPSRLSGLRTEMRGIPDGDYRIEWCDTWERLPAVEQRGRCTGGVLELPIPPFSRDIACRIGRSDGAALR
jgi:hypothetical protein